MASWDSQLLLFVFKILYKEEEEEESTLHNSPAVRTFEGGSQGCVSSDDHHRGLIRWNMWPGWKVPPFLLSQVGCVYLGMHELWESGNLMLETYTGNIPLQEEWSRSYALHSLHLSVIWMNWVLMLESGRCFSFHPTFFFSSSALGCNCFNCNWWSEW